MSLFSFKKEKKNVDALQKNAAMAKKTATEKVVKPISHESAPSAVATAANGVYQSDVLLNPRITEKATMLTESNVYVFDVRTNATKPEIAKAVHVLFKVMPRKVSTIQTPARAIIMRGRRGMKRAGKKAYVYLKKGEKIETA